MTQDDNQPTAPDACPERVEGRTFSLNSQEFYEAVAEPRERRREA